MIILIHLLEVPNFLPKCPLKHTLAPSLATAINSQWKRQYIIPFNRIFDVCAFAVSCKEELNDNVIALFDYPK